MRLYRQRIFFLFLVKKRLTFVSYRLTTVVIIPPKRCYVKLIYERPRFTEITNISVDTATVQNNDSLLINQILSFKDLKLNQ